MRRILVINGPNLNVLGTRQPEIYGTTTLNDLDAACVQWGERLGLGVVTRQSNHEGEILDAIHAAAGTFDGLVINPGALAYSSYSIADAITAAGLPAVEVHISNIREREPFRAVSVIAPACVRQIYGRGIDGYDWAIRHLVYRSTGSPGEHPYGPEQDQVGELRTPPQPGPHPVAVLLHGGFWRDQWTRDLMDGLAVDLYRRGWATWNLEYRRIPPLGGWRAVLADAMAGIEALASLAAAHHLDLGRVVVLGHSAGGHLAMLTATATEAVPVAQVVSLAGVLDLAPLYDPADPDNGPARLVGPEGPAVFSRLSPIERLPIGTEQLVVHGTLDDTVSIQVSRAYVEAASRAGDPVEPLWLEGVGHMELIDPASEAWAAVVHRLRT